MARASGVELEVTGDTLISGIDATMRGISSLRRWLQGPLVTVVQGELRQQFLSQGRYFLGRSWAALAPSTLRRKAALGVEHLGILRRTDRLFDSAKKLRSGEAVLEADETTLTIDFSAIEYAGKHNDPEGFVVKKKNGDEVQVPARPWLPDPENPPRKYVQAVYRSFDVELDRRYDANIKRRERRKLQNAKDI